MEATNGNGGYVYLMRNKSMPARVKIGFTLGNPMDRANELSTPTGVPEPFEVVWAMQTSYPREVEAEVHRELEHFGLRVSPSREFFKANQESLLHVVSDDELNRYFMLVIRQSAEQVELFKRLEALRTEEWDMKARHSREIWEFTSECMKKNSPQQYEEMLQRLRKGAEPDGSSITEN